MSKKIKVCDQLFAKTYQASRGNILSRKDTIVIKDKIGKIKESIQEELNFYQGFYQNILLGLPINVDFNKLNLIKQKQALLTGSLKTIINVPEIPDVYRNDMLKFIINRLENATLANKNKDSIKKSTNYLLIILSNTVKTIITAPAIIVILAGVSPIIDTMLS